MTVTPSPKVCIKCKGRLWCGPKCFILEKFEHKKSLVQKAGKEFQGNSPPGVFVSWQNYPNISIAPLSPTQIVENADLLDNPEKWITLSSEKIVSFREQLIRPTEKIFAKQAANPSNRVQKIQEIVMTEKSPVMEISLQREPNTELRFSDSTAPIGPSAPLKEFHVTENVKIDSKIDYIVSDTDLKANLGLKELYEKGIQVSRLEKLISAGLLGVKKNRKFTPTRWSITGTHSNLSLQMIDRIREFEEIDCCKVFQSHYLDNHWFILLIPRSWSYEQMEVYRPGASWNLFGKDIEISSDYEFFEGRKNYAENVAGGYYASRLAICEYLEKVQKQASVVIFREIGPEYKVGLGVWQCLENCRNAMQNSPQDFPNLNSSLEFIFSNLTIPRKFWLETSKVLKFIKTQTRITDWFKAKA